MLAHCNLNARKRSSIKGEVSCLQPLPYIFRRVTHSKILQPSVLVVAVCRIHFHFPLLCLTASEPRGSPHTRSCASSKLDYHGCLWCSGEFPSCTQSKLAILRSARQPDSCDSSTPRTTGTDGKGAGPTLPKCNLPINSKKLTPASCNFAHHLVELSCFD